MKRWHESIERSAGFSIVELLVALVLGLLLVAGVLQIFGGSRQTFSSNESLARVQENVRFALEEIKTSARGSTSLGFCGNRPEPVQHLNVPGDWRQGVFARQSSIFGWEFSNTGITDAFTVDGGYPTAGANSWVSQPRQLDNSTPDVNLPDLFFGATVRPVRDSDIFVVRQLTPIPGVTADNTTTRAESTINLTDNHGLDDGDLVLVSDCLGADLFRNRSGGSVLSREAGGDCGVCPGNQALGLANWESQHFETLQIYRVDISAYFVGFNTDRGQPGLYRMDLSSCPCGAIEEVVDGVENMQVLYGYSLPGSQGGDGQTVAAGNWYTADQFNDWWPIIGARVSMLQRSQDVAGTAPLQRVFNMSGTFVTNPLDTSLRHDASATLALRNRVMVDD